MTTFFSVDVESTATNPWDGYLLTIGIQPVRWVPGVSIDLMPDKFYVRLDRSEDLDYYWRLSIDPAEDPRAAKDETYVWWLQQNEVARGEAWQDKSLVRHDTLVASQMMTEWVKSLEPDHAQRIFVANPVAFDHGWINELLATTTGEDDTFHYRSLCLRSMKFGLRPLSTYGSDRANHNPEIPHHAFHDAYAQALDLIEMLKERDGA